MELINQTAVPAELMVSDTGMKDGERRLRAGCLVAKATFQARGTTTELVTDDPLPIFRAPEPTPFGDIPTDVRARVADGVEVVVLAMAHAPGGRPVEQMRVRIDLGDLAHELLVTGDRTWIGRGSESVASPPLPFSAMPLTWARAFGGTADVWWDQHTRVPIQHPVNPQGVGFDAERFARGMTPHCPPGFPMVDGERRLPNVEDPTTAVTRWEDDPLPACWAASSGGELVNGRVYPAVTPAMEATMRDAAAEGHRVSHPRLRLERLDGPLHVRLSGCTDAGVWDFRVPAMPVSMSYVLGSRRSERLLQPSQVVILAEEQRFTLTYECWFKFWVDGEDAERSIRLVVGDRAIS